MSPASFNCGGEGDKANDLTTTQQSGALDTELTGWQFQTIIGLWNIE